MYQERLKELKKRNNISIQKISELSGIPESTISRILSGQTESPSFVTVVEIIKAMGGSVDELVGIARPVEEVPKCEINQQYIDTLCGNISDLKENIKEVKAESVHRRHIITILIIALFIIVATAAVAAGLFLWVDLSNGDLGFFFREIARGATTQGVSFM